ncbi:MAG: AI-2E family transporter [Alphaproteobacteria bacterium]|nr:AI-2E family transporter [Alphaproteobacteria bacterium]
MIARNQIYFWLLVFFGFIGFIYLFGTILLPFVMAMGVAYLLNPLVARLGRLKIKRGPAALLILGVFLLIVALILAVTLPILYRQLLQLSDDLPGYYSRLMEALKPITRSVQRLTRQQNMDIGSLIQDNPESAGAVAGAVLSGVKAGGQAVIGGASILVFMPILAYFMMKEWPAICCWVKDLLPRDKKDVILDLLSQIDRKIANFLRGQTIVAATLGVAYALALSIAGLKYGFLIGLSAGVLSIIPMVGSTAGLIISMAVAWFQAGDVGYVAVIASIFLVGQLIEGNFLTPKLVGDSMGMHPLWVFFALLAGGALFGVLGMMLAVPVAAIIGVLAGFFLKKYKDSLYYTGVEPAPPVADEEG